MREREKNFHRIRHSTWRRHLKNKGGNFEQFVDLRDALFDEFPNFNAFIKTFQNNYPFPFQSFFLARRRHLNTGGLILVYGSSWFSPFHQKRLHQSDPVTLAKLKPKTSQAGGTRN